MRPTVACRPTSTAAHPRTAPGGSTRIDRIQATLIPLVVGLLWFGGAVLGMGYSLIRALPVVGDKVSIAQLDSFLVDWFGDLRVLLHDPAQSANIRSRVAETLATMRDDYACTSIVLVAHSGGVIVSLELLGDPRYSSPDGRGAFPITKLITIGEAMAAAWSLWDAWLGKLPPGDRLLASPYIQYPKLKWLDLYGTYDPAAAGRFRVPVERETVPPPEVAPGDTTDAMPGSAVAADADAQPVAPPPTQITPGRPARAGSTATDAARPIYRPPRSVPIWNRMSFREDHGGYWDNDEEYTVALVRELDTASGGASRFFADDGERTMRVRRRVERVATLGWWRLLAAIAALATIGVALAHGTASGTRLADIGAFAAQAYGGLPGHEIGSSPFELVAGIATQIGNVPGLGPVVIGLAEYLVVLAALVVAVSISRLVRLVAHAGGGSRRGTTARTLARGPSLAARDPRPDRGCGGCVRRPWSRSPGSAIGCRSAS